MSCLGTSGGPATAAVRRLVQERKSRNWCLFLDRDGVLNRRVVGDYVRDREQFEWLPNASLAVAELRDWAPYLVVVTNQQGVGKGFMGMDDVASIHEQLQRDLTGTNLGAIDSFLVCPHLAGAGCCCRKPKAGLVLRWLDRHPRSEPSLCVVVGDSRSDMELASNVAAATGGCGRIYIGDGDGDGGTGDADACFTSLWEFACAVKEARICAGDREVL